MIMLQTSASSTRWTAGTACAGLTAAAPARPRRSTLTPRATAEAEKMATAAAASVIAPAKQSRGHQAPAPSAPPDPALLRLREHQSAAARQPFADECRTLLRLSRYGVLSTLGIAPETEGYPCGSIVGYADEVEGGAPIFVFSTLSGHTRDVMQDGRASLTVTTPGFQGAADPRVCLTGRMTRIPDEEKQAARDRYLEVHPDAFWVDFGDFSWWRLSEIVGIRLVGGFARAGSIPPKLYMIAKPDPVAGICQAEIDVANAKGPAAWVAAVREAVGVDAGIEDVAVVSLDRLGLNLRARRGKDATKLRLPFKAPADTPEAVKAAIFELLAAGPS